MNSMNSMNSKDSKKPEPKHEKGKTAVVLNFVPRFVRRGRNDGIQRDPEPPNAA